MSFRNVRYLMAAGLLTACTERAGSTAAPTAFVWRNAGGETTDFGGNDPPECEGDSSPITREGVQLLGFDPDPDLAQIEGVREADLVWSEERCYSAGTCPHTRLTQTTRLESLELLSLRPREGSTASDCNRRILTALLHVELATADGGLAGSFPASVSTSLDRLGADAWTGVGIASLGDFHGAEQVLVDESRPHWDQVDLQLAVGLSLSGSFEATILYTDGVEPAEQWATRRATWSSTVPPIAYGDPLPQAPDSFVLDDYPGSLLPPTFDVAAMPRFDQPGAMLDVSVNGALTHYDSIPEDQLLELGALRIGDVVSADVSNAHGGWVGAALRISTCSWVSSGCSSPGCSAHVETTIAPVRCPRYPYLD